MRTSVRQLRSCVEILSRDGYSVALDYANGRTRLTNLSGDRNLGPRLPTGQQQVFLDGVRAGIELEQERVRIEAAKEGN